MVDGDKVICTHYSVVSVITEITPASYRRIRRETVPPGWEITAERAVGMLNLSTVQKQC